MGITFGLGDSNNQFLKELEATRKQSRQQYWENQQQIPLLNLEGDSTKKLITIELLENGVTTDYIKDARYFVHAKDCRGWYNPTTEIVVFGKNEFKDVELTFDREFALDDYLEGLYRALDPKTISERPRVLSPKDEGFKVTVKMLNKAFYGWLGDARVDGSYKPICELSESKPKVVLERTIGGEFYTSFTAKREDGRIAWSYFPLNGENFKPLEFADLIHGEVFRGESYQGSWVNVDRLFGILNRMSPGYGKSLANANPKNSGSRVSAERVFARLNKMSPEDKS